MLVVLDTSVLVAAWRSRNGASFALVSRVGEGAFEIALSVPLLLEYEAVLGRYVGAKGLTNDDLSAFLDYICSVSRAQGIFFLWRPLLRDPNDDMVAELAVAAGCKIIVTHNIRDFQGVERFGIEALTPAAFLRKVGGLK